MTSTNNTTPYTFELTEAVLRDILNNRYTFQVERDANAGNGAGATLYRTKCGNLNFGWNQGDLERVQAKFGEDYLRNYWIEVVQNLYRKAAVAA